MNQEKIQAIINSLTPKEKDALREAIAAIYFQDSADYIRGLWNVVNVLIGDKLDLDELDIKEWLYTLSPELRN